MIHLKSVTFNKNSEEEFPYHLPFYEKTIKFTTPITILVGENGSGKSTFIELLNEVLKLHRIHMDDVYQKDLQDVLSEAARSLSLNYNTTKPKGFFFSAEDFTSYIHFLVKEKNYAKEELKRVNSEYKNKSNYSKQMASMPFARTIHQIDDLYSRDLLKSSHGESYLAFFGSRVKGNELYLLDEPETPLSIQNQLSLLLLINEGVINNSQFIIATHSPIMMAIPGARILEISSAGIKEISYQEIESVNLLKQFLNKPEVFFKHLF